MSSTGRQVLVLVHGSAVDVAWAEASPRVGAILSAFYPGQMVRACASDPQSACLTLTPQVVCRAGSGMEDVILNGHMCAFMPARSDRDLLRSCVGTCVT